MFIEWTDAYKIGIPSIDDDHKDLVDLVNLFFARTQDSADARELADILDKLIDRTRVHFIREEVMLDRNDYPQLAPHKAEHDRLLQQMSHFQTSYRQGTASARDITIDTAEFFRHWLLDHILEEDFPYRAYIMKLS